MFLQFPWIDEQYINRIGFKLDGFTKERPTVYNCRCPICGDSQKRSSLARGYFVNKAGNWYYYCHNCGVSMGVYWFLKAIDKTIADEYQIDIYKERYKFSPPKKEAAELTKDDIPLARLPKIKSRETPANLICMKDMSDEHPAKQYILKRKIPSHKIGRLFYISKYRKWNAPLLKKEFNPKWTDHPRLIIPYYWLDGTIFRYSARAFGNEEPRYQQTIIDEDKPRVYGLDTLDITRKSYILEGQIDSLFLPNALAVGSANYNIPILNTIPDKIIVPDNQPRNPDVVKQIGAAIASGHRVCIWKEDYGKDINQMVLNHNLTEEDLTRLIDESAVSGIEANLKFGKWRKC